MTEPTSSRDSGAPEEKLVGADRVIAVLTELADHPLGVTLDELAGTLRSSKPTVHRALATLRRAGLADMTGRGVYVLGDEYLRLAFRNLDGRPETARVQPLLEQLAARLWRDRALRRALRQRHRLPGEGRPPARRGPPDLGDRRPQSGVSHGCRQSPAEHPTHRPRNRCPTGSAPSRSSRRPRAHSRHRRLFSRSWRRPVAADSPSMTRRTRSGSTASRCPCTWMARRHPRAL